MSKYRVYVERDAQCEMKAGHLILHHGSVNEGKLKISTYLIDGRYNGEREYADAALS